MRIAGTGTRWPAKVVAGVLLLALVCMMMAFPATTRTAKATGTAMGVYDEPRVTKLMYPTLGNPAIVKKGTTFTLEFDPRDGWPNTPGRHHANPDPIYICDQWQVTVTPAKVPNTPAWSRTWTLAVTGATYDISSHWQSAPYAEELDLDHSVYKLTLSVPADLPSQLYDVRVQTRAEEWTNLGVYIQMDDGQPHALDVVDDFKTNFNVMQISDVHVFGTECTYLSSNSKERSTRTSTYTEANGYATGANFFHKEIMEINRIHPDFVIFTGDYDFGQSYWNRDNGGGFGNCTEYEYEQLWFYQELQALQVPVYMVIGNHDGYKYPSDHTNEDNLVNWTLLYGPDYYSFDYGNYHFLSINSMDWNSVWRTLTLFSIPFIGDIMQPVKYMGAVASGGDPWAPGGFGWSQQRFDNINYSYFAGQMKWIKDDLASHQASTMRICALHHDPYKDGGDSTSGSMWASQDISGYLDMGDGEGRLSLIKLFRDYKVNAAISGHDHSDYYGAMSWLAGGGETKFINSTSASFQNDDNTNASVVYPGFKWLFFNGANLDAYGYPGTQGAGPGTYNLSYPFYRYTNVGGSSNLHTMSDPAIKSLWVGTPGTSTDLTCTIYNYWGSAGGAAPLNNPYVRFPMPYLSDHHYYALTGAQGGLDGKALRDSFWENSDSSPTYRVYDVTGNNIAGTYSNAVRMYDAGVDSTLPTGTLNINGGELYTQDLNVTLNISGTDSQSGIRDMMVSNDPSFTGASWEKYSTSKVWNLAAGGYGTRTVYLKFRDMAMGPNESTTISHSIQYDVPRPTITSLSTDSATPNTMITINGNTFGASRGTSTVSFGIFPVTTYGTWSDTAVQVQVPADAYGNGVTVWLNRSGYPDASAPNPFNVLPYLTTALSPISGVAGTSVTLTGNGFCPTRSTSQVYFDSVEAATYTSWSNHQIVVTVPVMATGDKAVKVSTTWADSNTKPFNIPTPPHIDSLSAPDGDAGTTITVTGTAFGASQGSSTVSFGAFTPVPADYVSWSNTSIQVKVPAGAYGGPQGVVVHTAAGGDSNSMLFSVTPHIASLNPTAGEVGWIVNLSGSAFGPAPAHVYFDATEATVTSWANGALQVTVPPLTTNADYPVKVTTSGGDSNLATFHVNPASLTPHINSLDTIVGYPGATVVTLGGTNFGTTQGSSYVRFGSFAPAPADYVSWANTQVQVRVPAGAYGTTDVRIHTADGDSTWLGTFYMMPYISTVSPTWGNAGVTYITLTGAGFGPTRGTNSVWFDGSKASTYSSWSNTRIVVQVGAGAQGQSHVKVMVMGCFSNAKAFDVRPLINSISPTSGPTNTVVTISGSSFCNSKGTGCVYFGSKAATTYTSWKQTQIKVKVPSGISGTVQLKVYTSGGMSNYKNFTKT